MKKLASKTEAILDEKDEVMAEKRRQYRTPGQGELEIEVIRDGSTKFSGKVVDISAQGVSLSFSAEEEPNIELREIVLLKVTSTFLEKSIVVPSMVIRREELEEGWTYGIEFIDWLGLLAQLPPALAEMFNRRGDYRVEPIPEDPIQVTLEALPLRVNAWLRDISIVGLSAFIPSNLETVFRKVRKAQVSFNLPRLGKKLKFQGRILHRHLTESGVCYGIVFVEETTRAFQENQQLLAQYIQARKKEILGLPVS